jgi:hypothetical protein
MRKITFLLFALLISFVGYSQFPTPGTEGFETPAGPDLPLATAVSPWTLGTGATGNQWAVFDNGVAVAAVLVTLIAKTVLHPVVISVALA